MKIAILDDYQDCVRTLGAWSKLAGHDVTVFRDTLKDVDALAKRLAPFEAVVLIRERTRFPAELIARLPNLRLVSQTGKNAPHVDLAACTARRIPVCGGGRSAFSTSELTWALILGGMRRVYEEAGSLRAGGWQSTLGTTVRGRTLGIVGYGNIGAQVAHVGKAFAMKIRAWGREGSRERAARDGIEVAASMEDLLASADIVTLHVSLNAATRGMIGAAQIACMKPGAMFVNTSRAGLVDTAALVAGLKAGRPGYAAVDVFDDEPVSGARDPILGAPNVLATPHLGYVERDNYESLFEIAFDQVLAFAAGKPINVMNPEALA
jgi:D-3-phosphoglycerate dehydrogenase